MKKGFTLLIAILVSAVLLSIALAIFDLTTRQLELSTTAQNSQLALFAADSGIECANYWDLQKQEFPFAGGSLKYSQIACGQSANIPAGPPPNPDSDSSGDPTIATSTFDFSIQNGTADTYVEVDVVKFNYASGDQGTIVYSYGYNSGPNDADPSRIERALRETYGSF